MKHVLVPSILPCVLLTVLASTLALAATRAAADDEKGGTLARLEWLAGSWSGTYDGGTWESTYTTPDGGMILSMSKELKNGRVAMFEYERIWQDKDKVFVQPHPFGKGSVLFELRDFDPKKKRARFVNEKHDFPNELIYELKSKDNLVIDVLGGEGEHKQGFQLDLKRR